MLSVAEIATAAAAMATVVGVSVAATIYFAEDSDATSATLPIAESGPHRYVISDAYYLCRDHISTAVSSDVRNIHVDSHSSRYDEGRNDNLVFIDLEVMDRADPAAAQAAKIVCRVSAADNEIKSFQVNKG